MSIIVLDFLPEIRGLAGYELGLDTYKNQIEALNKDSAEKLVLTFPDSVEMVSSSFVQGLFEEIVEQVGYGGLKEKVTIESTNKDLAGKIWDRVF